MADAVRQFLAGLAWAPSWWDLLLLAAFGAAVASVPSVLLRRRGNPQAAMSWLLILFSLPLVGLFLWWAVGRRHLLRKRRKRLRAARQVSSTLSRLRDELPPVPAADWQSFPLQRLPDEDAEWVFPPTSGNHVRLLMDGEQFFPELERVIVEARDHIHLLFYIWHPDRTGERIRDLLVQKARDGVEVRVLCDGFGASDGIGEHLDPLRDAGGRAVAFMPPRYFTRAQHMNFRNHRKIVVVDGRVGIVGGFNIGDEYTHDWHDAAVRIEGPAVDQLQEVFVDDWHFATGEDFVQPRHIGRFRQSDCGFPIASPGDSATCAVIASGPHTTQNITHDAFFISITRANQRVWITTPYFIPDGSIMMALRTAVYRGVDVRVLVPEKSDQPIVRLASRSYYPELLGSGVRIFEYTPAVLHAKTLVIDDQVGAVGSANIDVRSFKLNFEVNCFVRSPALASELAGWFERDQAQSREMSLVDLEHRSMAAKLVESAAHLLSPLL